MTGNTATCMTRPSAGSHGFTATYSGNSRYATSSGGLTQQVQPATLTVTAVDKSRVFGAANPAFTWTVSGLVNGDPGTVVTGSPSCATAAGPTSAVGSYAINCTAASLAATNYTFGFTSGTLSVTQASTSIGLTSSINPSVFGQPVTFTAVVAAVAPGAGTPAGTVQFKVDGAIFGAALNLVGGTATSAALATSVGSHSITAVYSGNTNFIASTGALTETVNNAASAVALISSVNPSVFGEPVTFTATVVAVAPGAGTPGGTVQFKVDGVNFGPVVTLVGGTATSTILTAGVGIHTTTAVYSGDSSFVGSTGAFNQTVNKALTTTWLTSSLNPSVYGQMVTFTAAVAPVAPGAGMPTGAVTFNEGTAAIGSATPNSSGIATLSLTTLEARTHSLTAVYGGDASFFGSTSPVLLQMVRKADQTIDFPLLANQLFGAAPFTVTATATSGLPVSFSAAGQCIVSGSTVTIAGGGSCSITARQPGDDNYNAATPMTRTFNIAWFPSRMVFGLPGAIGTVAPATLVFSDQQPVTEGGCTGTFALTISIGPFTISVGSGTFAATTTGTVATARLVGTLAPLVTFTATLTLDTATQTGTLSELFVTEDGPVTVAITFAKSASIFVITGATVTP